MAAIPKASFRPSLWPTVATLLGIALLVGLGSWQLQRLGWKEALIAARAAKLAAPPAPLPANAPDWQAFDFRKVEVTGSFRHDLEQHFGARAEGGRLGHAILTPLIRPDGPPLLVDRGWVPEDRSEPQTRTDGQLAGLVTIHGIARYRGADRPGWFAATNDPARSRWFTYDLPALRARLGLDLLPLVIEADATPNPGGLPQGGQTVPELANNHLHYALTWYALAVALLAVYVAFSRRQQPAVEPAPAGRGHPLA